MNARARRQGLTGAGLLLAVLAAPVLAQAGGNGWTPFVGCWEPLDAAEGAGLLCFRLVGSDAEMFNVVDGEVVSREQLSADGTPRPVSAEGCSGFESASFSGDGQRVFTRSEYTCGDEIRAGSGVMSFLAPTLWIDVRSLVVEGEPVAWAQRYYLADADDLAGQGIEDPAAFDPTLVRAARAAAAQDIAVDDVEEAAGRVDTRAAEVWVAANETELELSGSELVRLADAGVPESLIDVMVAVSFPEHFVLGPDGTAAEQQWVGGAPGPYAFGPYPLGPPPPWFGFGFYYSPFGYYGGGCCGYYGGYRPVIIAPAPRPDGPPGRMVPGRGYTRGSASASASGGASRSGPSASSRSRGGNGGGGASSGSTSTSSSGRTARPRGS